MHKQLHARVSVCICSCIDSWFEINRSCPEHPSDWLTTWPTLNTVQGEKRSMYTLWLVIPAASAKFPFSFEADLKQTCIRCWFWAVKPSFPSGTKKKHLRVYPSVGCSVFKGVHLHIAVINRVVVANASGRFHFVTLVIIPSCQHVPAMVTPWMWKLLKFN